MAVTDGLLELEKSLWQWARVDAVISPTQFQANRLQAYGDGFFSGWTVYVLRDIRTTSIVVAAPQGEQQIATGFIRLNGVVTHPAFTAPMVAGDEVLMIHPNIATAVAILAALGVPAANSIINLLERDVIGNKSDTANAVADNTSSLMRYTKAILAALGPTSVAQGLYYYGVVTAVPGANQFTIPALIGQGASKFADATAPYRAFVFRDAGGVGAAPQGEMQSVTGYVTATGVFTAPGFGGGGVAANDEILIIHPRLADILAIRTQTDRLNGTETTGVFAHQNNLLWQTVFTLPGNTRTKVHSIWLDFTLLTQNMTYRLSYDYGALGVFVVFDSNAAAPWTPALDDGILIACNFVRAHQLRLELQSAVLEGAIRNIPYEVYEEAME